MSAPRSERSGEAHTDRGALAALTAEIVACRRCPRLVAWRERVASEKVRRFQDEPYWGRPLPGFGDADARILIVGLAPAAHGGPVSTGSELWSFDIAGGTKPAG